MPSPSYEFLSLTDQLHVSNEKKYQSDGNCVHLQRKRVFFCAISVGKNCRNGSNTLLFTNKQRDQLHRLVAIIQSQDVFKIIEHILFPLQIVFFFTDYSSRFQIIVFA